MIDRASSSASNRLPAALRRCRRAVAGGALSIPLLLAACSSQSDQPGTVTADEAHQLNDAAAMLDANSVDRNAAVSNESDDE